MTVTRWMLAVALLACWPMAASAAFKVGFNPGMALVAPGTSANIDIVVTEASGGETIFGYDFFLTLEPKDAAAADVTVTGAGQGDADQPGFLGFFDFGPVPPYDVVYFVTGSFQNAGDEVAANLGDVIATITVTAGAAAGGGYNLLFIEDPGAGFSSAVYAVAGAIPVADTTFEAGMVLTPEPGSAIMVLAGAAFVLGARNRRGRKPSKPRR